MKNAKYPDSNSFQSVSYERIDPQEPTSASETEAEVDDNGGSENDASDTVSQSPLNGDISPTRWSSCITDHDHCALDSKDNNVNVDDGIINANYNSSSDLLLSVDNAVELLGFGPFQFMVLIASGLCFAADGSQVMLLSLLTPILKDNWRLSNEQAAALTSTVFAGAMVGTLILGPLADKIGRRPVFLLASTIIMFSGLGMACAPSFGAGITAIFLVGTGIGGLTVPFDIFAEFLPAAHRGTNLLKIEYAWTAGVLYVVVLTFSLIQRDEPAWRLVTALCACPCALSLVVGYIYVPESPQWLVSKGRTADAIQVLRKAAVTNGVADSGIFPEALALRSYEQESHATLSDLFQPKWRRIIFCLWGTWFASAFGYYGTMLVVTRVFFVDRDKGDDKSSFDYHAIFVSSVAEFAGTSLAILVVDRIGRRRSQITAYLLAGLLLCLLCVMAEWKAARGALISISFCARAFEMAGTCVTWVATAEVLPTEIRGTGHSTANAMARIGAMFCPFLVESKIPLVHVGIVLMIVHSATALFVANLPETMGRGMGSSINEDDGTLAVQPDLFSNDPVAANSNERVELS